MKPIDDEDLEKIKRIAETVRNEGIIDRQDVVFLLKVIKKLETKCKVSVQAFTKFVTDQVRHKK